MENVYPLHALYRDAGDGRWYWTARGLRPIGPFSDREAARADFRKVIGIVKGRQTTEGRRNDGSN